MATTKTICCTSCPNTIRIRPSCENPSTGEIMSLCSFKPIIMDNTSIKWMCSDCVAKIIPHILAIKKMLPDEGVYWNGLKYLPSR